MPYVNDIEPGLELDAAQRPLTVNARFGSFAYPSLNLFLRLRLACATVDVESFHFIYLLLHEPWVVTLFPRFKSDQENTEQ